MNFLRRRSFAWFALTLTALASAVITNVRAQERPRDVIKGGPTAADGAIVDAASEVKPVAVVALAPYSQLVSDIGFLGSLAGKPELGQMIEGGFAFFTQGKGPEALDKTKPWGIIAQTDGASLLPVICLPVKNFGDVVGIATAFGAQVADGDEGTKVLSLPNGETIYLKSEGGWAFASKSPESLAKLPANPAGVFEKMVTDYDVAIKVAMKNMPDSYRQLAIQGMQSGMEQQLVRTEDETDEEFEARRRAAEAQMQQMVQVIDDIDTLSLGWSIDAEQQRTFLDFTYVVKPNSKSERQLAAYNDATTNFAGFYQPDAASTLTFAMKADAKMIEEDIEQMNAGMAQLRAQFNKALEEKSNIEDEETREMIKIAAGDIFDALEATVKAGRFDGGATVNVGPDSLTVIAGTHVKEPAKVEAGLRKIEEAAKKREGKNSPSVQWNAAKHGNVTFHTLTVPVPEHLDAPRRMLGSEANIAIGVGPEAVYLAIGNNNMDAVNKAIDASAAEPNKSVPPFEWALSLGPILETVAAHTPQEAQRHILESVAKMLKSDASGRDHVRMVSTVVPRGLRYRLEVEEGVLRGIGKATAEAQRQMLEAQPQAR